MGKFKIIMLIVSSINLLGALIALVFAGFAPLPFTSAMITMLIVAAFFFEGTLFLLLIPIAFIAVSYLSAFSFEKNKKGWPIAGFVIYVIDFLLCIGVIFFAKGSPFANPFRTAFLFTIVSDALAVVTFLWYFITLKRERKLMKSE